MHIGQEGLVFPSLSEFSTVSFDPQVKGFGIVNKAEIDVFLELSCFFNDPEDVGSLISGSSAFLKTSLNIWMFTVHILLKPDTNGHILYDFPYMKYPEYANLTSRLYIVTLLI